MWPRRFLNRLTRGAGFSLGISGPPVELTNGQRWEVAQRTKDGMSAGEFRSMSVTILSVLLVLSSLGVMASSLLNYAGRWAEVAQLCQEPELADDTRMPVEHVRPVRVADLRSVLRSVRRIGDGPALPAVPLPPAERAILDPYPLPVAPALQPVMPVPAVIWPSVRFLGGSAATASVATAGSRFPGSTTQIGRPRLTLACQAPEAADLGSQVRYKLAVRNTGDGVAERVVVEPQILSGGGNRLSTVKRFPVGDLLPGEACDLTLRDLARDADWLQVRFFATDCSGSEAAAVARGEVRRPAVKISLDVPQEITLGHQTVFEIHAANAGAGAAETVRVRCSASEGLRLTVLDQQVQFTTHAGQVTWALGRLAAGETRVLRLKARPTTAGEQLIRVAIESELDEIGKLPRPVAAEKTITVRDRDVDQRIASW
jgi:uncharacterized repeat protein (TIGR01451 family)